MTRPKILVTGATGKTGHAVVTDLLRRQWPVRAVVHARDARSEALDRQGVETVVADLYDPEQLLVAMRGTERAYYLTPFQPLMIQSAVAFAVAAREAKLEAIVGLSQWLASPSHPSILTRQTWLVDKLFSMLPGIAHVTINPGYFADNYLRFIDFAAHLGILPNLTGDSRNAPPSNEDIARVAVAALIDPDKHAGRCYRPTGPALLSSRDMAEILSRILNRTIRSVTMPWWLLTRAARLQGVHPFDLYNLRYYTEDHKQSAFAFGAPTDDVYEVTGQPPEPFEVTARRYAALPKANRTIGNTMRAWANFLRTPFAPGYDLDRFERAQGFPAAPDAKLAMRNERWKAERALQAAQWKSPPTVSGAAA